MTGIIAMATLLSFVSDRAGYAWSWRVSNSEITLESQVWQGHKWRHDVTVDQPTILRKKGIAVLIITGDRVPTADGPYGRKMAEACQLPVFTLFSVPNQPLWEMREDDLIAHTFAKYIETGDSFWPLLFPMVRSAARAMDAITEATAKTENPIRRFVVTGASKRGWTTWLMGALKDQRVAGLVPTVFDNLNFATQLRHQNELWGELSPKIADYTRRQLQETLSTEAGRKLVSLVDPFAYRFSMRTPTLAVVGSQDPYWTVDAHALYWDQLPAPKWLCVVPNRGHDLGGAEIAAVGAMTRHVSGQRMPKAGATWNDSGASFQASEARKVTIWEAVKADFRFADAQFRPIWTGGPLEKAIFPEAKTGSARFAEFDFGDFRITTIVQVKR